MADVPFPNIVSGITTGAVARISLNNLGKDNNVAIKEISSINNVDTEISYHITGSIVFDRTTKKFYQYDGNVWNETTDILSETNSHSSLTTDSKTITGSINEIHSELSYLSAGVFGTPTEITDNGDGTATFTGVDVLLYPNPDYTGTIKKYTVSGGTFSFTDGAEEYVAIKYNGGTPIMYKETVLTNLNYSDVICAIVCWRVGSTIHSLNLDSSGNGLTNKIQIADFRSELYKRSVYGGLVIAETTSPNPRTITVSSSTIYAGGIPITVSSFASNTDTMTMVYHVNGVWTYANNLVYNNTQYDDGQNLVTIPTQGSKKRWSTRWFYRSVGDVKQVFYVLGNTYYEDSLSASADQPRSDLPVVLVKHCVLVGRSIIQLDATSGITQSTLGTSFTGSNIINHNDTLNKQGGSAELDEYYHVTNAEKTKIENLNTMASQASNSVSISGGFINGVKYGDNTNYSQFESNGILRFIGTAKPWTDMLIEPVARTTGANAPTFEKYLDNGAGSRGVFLYSFDNANAGSEKEIFFNLQMSHAWDSGNIHLHVHWIGNATQGTASKVRWGLEYSWVEPLGTFGNTTIIYADTVEGGDTTVTAKKHYITEFAEITPSTSQDGLSTILMGRIFRDSANAADTYTGKAGILYIDCHYQLSSIGSAQEYVK